MQDDSTEASVTEINAIDGPSKAGSAGQDAEQLGIVTEPNESAKVHISWQIGIEYRSLLRIEFSQRADFYKFAV